jgi:pimeloyl-ACP methyl ester carboxylesterase
LAYALASPSAGRCENQKYANQKLRETMAANVAQGIIAAMTETARTLARGGATVAWWRRGGGAAGTVLLVHGLASNATRWAEFAQASTLPPDWALLRVDLRGHGRSTAPRRATLEDWCADLAALLDAEGAADAVVVGHSLGAQVALHLAAAQPARVRALVLIDPVFRDALSDGPARTARLAPLFRAAAAAIGALNAIGLRRRHVEPDDLQALDRLAREALKDPASEAAFIARYSSTRHDLRQMRSAQYLQDVVEMFRPPPALARIAVPVLTLLSSGATFAPEDTMRARLAALPQGTIARIDCHHWPLTERPVEVREAIEAWVRPFRRR